MKKFLKYITAAVVMAAVFQSFVCVSADENETDDCVRIYGKDIAGASGTVIPGTETWDNGILTVGKIRNNKADAAEDDYYSAYTFETDKSGVYSIRASANRWDINQYSAYAFKVDDGEYITINNGTVKNIGYYDANEDGKTAQYALRSFELKEKFYLEAGEHTFYIKAVTNSVANNTDNGITVYFNYAEFKIAEPEKNLTIHGNEYIGVSEPDMLNIIGVNGAPSVTLFKGSSLPEGGIIIDYSFFADFDGYYDIEISAGNYNNVYLSRSAIAVDDNPYMKIDSTCTDNMRKAEVYNDMCIYTMKEPVYLTTGKHSFKFKILDECINDVYEFFEYVKFSLQEDFEVKARYAVNDGGEKLYKLSDTELAKGCAELANYSDAAVTATLIAALYSGQELKGLKTKDITVPAGERMNAYTDSIAVKHGENDRLEVTVWNSLNGQVPLTDKYIISESGIDNPLYDEELAMLPLWNENRTYNETVILVSESGSASDAQGELLYTPERIVSVTSADKKTIYKEGVDWEYSDGKLRLLEGSSAPYLTYDELYVSGADGTEFWSGVSKRILYTETTFWHEHQLAVTYDHENIAEEDFPRYAGEILKKTSSKLAAGEDVCIVLNGDSISTGANMSGFKLVDPYMPIWGELFYNRLSSVFDSNIEFHNTSRGARTSEWAVENVERNITRLKPDLAIIAFGMNDASGAMRKAEFKKNISDMIDAVRAENPDTEFILVSGIAANPDAANVGMTIPELREGLYELEDEYEGVAAADVTAVHNMLLQKKKYIDMTGNNINHINDYMGRWYAQILSAMLIEQ